MLNERGVSLMELLIVGLLVGFVIFGSANMYVTGLKQSQRLRDDMIAMDPKASLEDIAKNVSVANEYNIVAGGPFIKSALLIRVDASVDINGVLTAKNTPANFNDDTWIKYAFWKTPALLLWRADAVGSGSESAIPTPMDKQLISNVHTTGADPLCEFLSMPSGASSFPPANERIVRIRLVTQTDPLDANTQNEVWTDVSLSGEGQG